MAFRLLRHLSVTVSVHRPGTLWDSESLPGCSLLSCLCLRPERGMSDGCLLRPGGVSEGHAYGLFQSFLGTLPHHTSHPHLLLFGFLRDPCLACPHDVSQAQGGLVVWNLEARRPCSLGRGLQEQADSLLSCPTPYPEPYPESACTALVAALSRPACISSSVLLKCLKSCLLW